MYVCMHACMYVCLYVYICLYMFIYVNMYIYICKYMCVYIYVYIYLYMFIYMCIYIYVYICIYIYMFIYVYMQKQITYKYTTHNMYVRKIQNIMIIQLCSIIFLYDITKCIEIDNIPRGHSTPDTTPRFSQTVNLIGGSRWCWNSGNNKDVDQI